METIVINARANPINNCRYNERLLLHVLRVKQKESKANLARLTGLTAAAVGGIISTLEEKGLVEVVGKAQGDMGQPATLYSLAREGAFGLGVSINRGHIETALINLVGDVVATKKHHCILPSPAEVLAMVKQDISELIGTRSFILVNRIAGIGVAQPYNFGSWRQDNLSWDAWDDFNLAAELGAATGLNAYTQNDANAAAIAELIYGVGAESQDFLYLFFGSALVLSLGGGVILDGQCRNGFSGNAGDIGLIPLPLGSIATSKSDCSETTTFLTNRCSLYSLVKFLRSNNLTIDNQTDFEDALNSHEALVNQWLQDCVEGLALAIYAIQALIDVPELILDCEDEDREVVDKIIAKLTRHIQKQRRSGLSMPSIRKGSFGSNAGAIGAATLPLDWSFSPKHKAN